MRQVTPADHRALGETGSGGGTKEHMCQEQGRRRPMGTGAGFAAGFSDLFYKSGIM